MTYLPKEQRRAEIIDAAMAVIDREGIAAATVRRVAQSLGASPGQIHHHFKSADALRAEAFLSLWHRTIEEYMKQVTTESPVDTIVSIMTGCDDEAVKQSFKRMYKDLLEASHRSPELLAVQGHILRTTRGHYVRLLQQACEKGELGAGIQIERLAISLMALSFGMGFMFESGFRDFDVAEIVRHQIALENALSAQDA